MRILMQYPLGPETETVDSPEHALPTWCSSDPGHDKTLRALADWRPDMVYSQGFEDEKCAKSSESD